MYSATLFSIFSRNKSISLLAVLMLLSGVQQAHADINLSFGLYTTDKPTTLIKKFKPVITLIEESMSKELDTRVNIKFSISKSYEQGMQELVDGKVDFSRLGPASYVEAIRQNPKLKLLAMETKKGRKTFKGIICVRQDSQITTVRELAGKRFAFGNKRSTIGRYLSQKYLFESGITASSLASYDYLGRHDKVGYAVALGTYDAGALKESTFKKLVKKGQPLKMLASFDVVTKPWIARSGMDRNIEDALRNALLSIKDKKALQALKKDGFALATEDEYQDIKNAINMNSHFFK